MPATLPTRARKLEAEATADLVAWARQMLGLTYREIAALTSARPIDRIRAGDVDAVVEVLAGAHAGAFA